MEDFIERGSKLYNSEELAWNRGDVLGIASAQQAQRNLESELYSQDTCVRKPSRLSGIMKPVLAGASIVIGAMAGVIYDNKIGSELVEDKIVYSAGNNSDFEFVDHKINFADAPVSIDTDGERISVLTEPSAINTVDLNTIGVLPIFDLADDKSYKDFSLNEGVASVKAKNAGTETFNMYFQDFENGLQGNLLPATRRDQGYTYWDYNHDSDSGRIIMNHENSAYLMNLSGAASLKSSPLSGENHIDPQVDGDNVIFLEYYSDAIFLSDDEFSFTQKIIDKGLLESFVLDGNHVAYTLNNGSKTELWVYDINESADKLIFSDFNPVGDIDISDGNLSWLEVNNYQSEIHVHNLEHDKEVVFGENYISRRDLKIGGSVLAWIQEALGGDEEAYFADIQGYNFNETNTTLEEVLPDYNLTEIQDEVNNQTSENVTLNRTDISQLLERISELENESAEYNLTLNYVAQLLIEIREEREAEAQRLEDLQEDWAEGNQTMENLSAGLNESYQTLEAMRQENDANNQTLEAMRQENEANNQTLEAMRQENENTQQTLEAMRQENEANNQTLYNLQQELAATNQSLGNVSAAPEEEDMLSKYGFWIGTAAATLTVGGFLLQNKRIRKLKPQLLESIVGEMGLKPGESKVIPPKYLPEEWRDSKIVIHGDFVKGDKHNEQIAVPVYKGEVNIATHEGSELTSELKEARNERAKMFTELRKNLDKLIKR